MPLNIYSASGLALLIVSFSFQFFIEYLEWSEARARDDES